MINKLFIAGLSYNITDQQLQEYFARIGKVLSAKIIIDKYTGQSRGFGFVEMGTAEEAKLAMDKLNNSDFDGRSIIVKEAKPQENGGRSFDNRNSNDTKRNRW